jgi:hypothetical protein
MRSAYISIRSEVISAALGLGGNPFEGRLCDIPLALEDLDALFEVIIEVDYVFLDRAVETA